MSGPIARRDDRSAEWFDGLARGVLLVRRCEDCGHRSRPDAGACAACLGPRLTWTPATGLARVVATVVDRSSGTERTLGLVELDEGPWLHVRLAGPTDVGAPVTATYLPPEGDEVEWLVVFAPRAEREAGTTPSAADGRRSDAWT